MDAMDWPALFRGALWIGGLSLALAAFSYARWAAKQEGVSLRMAVSRDSFMAPFFAGLALFAAGMAWGAMALWEIVAWVLVGVVFVAQALWSARSEWRGRKERSEAHETDQ
jgi:hypothetical protein